MLCDEIQQQFPVNPGIVTSGQDNTCTYLFDSWLSSGHCSHTHSPGIAPTRGELAHRPR